MELPKLYRKVWFELDYSSNGYEVFAEVRRTLREDKAWFWAIRKFDTYSIEKHVLDDIDTNPEEYLDCVIYKNPFNYDCRNIGCYDRPPIRKKEPEPIDTSIDGIDFDSDVPF